MSAVKRILITSPSDHTWWYDDMVGCIMDIHDESFHDPDEAYYLADTDFNREQYSNAGNTGFTPSFYILKQHFVYTDALDNEGFIPALKSMDDFY